MSTLVTAFITNVNEIDFRTLDTYMEYGKKIFAQSIPTVCFLEERTYKHYFADAHKLYPWTTFLFFEKQDNYLIEWEHELVDFFVHTDNPKKDTPDYMFIQCHKTEWIRMAIKKNPYHTSHFVWVDFGIYHMIQNDMEFAIALEELSKKKHDKIRIASCVDPDQICIKDLYRQIVWYFAGSIFGGPQELLLDFATNMKKMCLEIIRKEKHIMWEVNIWYLIYKQNPEWFDPFYSNHNISILKNY